MHILYSLYSRQNGILQLLAIIWRPEHFHVTTIVEDFLKDTENIFLCILHIQISLNLLC